MQLTKKCHRWRLGCNLHRLGRQVSLVLSGSGGLFGASRIRKSSGRFFRAAKGVFGSCAEIRAARLPDYWPTLGSIIISINRSYLEDGATNSWPGICKTARRDGETAQTGSPAWADPGDRPPRPHERSHSRWPERLPEMPFRRKSHPARSLETSFAEGFVLEPFLSATERCRCSSYSYGQESGPCES